MSAAEPDDRDGCVPANFDSCAFVDVSAGGKMHVVLAGSTGPLLLMLHGANFCSSSFSLLCGLLKGRCRIAALDLRGHGRSLTVPLGDLSMAALVQDVNDALSGYILPWAEGSSSGEPAPAPVPVVLVGHSLGAVIAVQLAATWRFGTASPTTSTSGGAVATTTTTTTAPTTTPPRAPHRCAGVVVLDFVEGTALQSLAHMAAVVQAMPTVFDSTQAAVEWTCSAGKLLHSRAAAAVSVPACLMPAKAAAPAATDAATISASASSSSPQGKGAVTWRGYPFLRASQAHWREWFTGVSAAFLRGTPATCGKLLILPGNQGAGAGAGGAAAGRGRDRLDDELLVGQMQGRFTLSVIPAAGHVLHEDAVHNVTQVLLTFLSRLGLLQHHHTVR